jgi:hypothetical protein
MKRKGFRILKAQKGGGWSYAKCKVQGEKKDTYHLNKSLHTLIIQWYIESLRSAVDQSSYLTVNEMGYISGTQ